MSYRGKVWSLIIIFLAAFWYYAAITIWSM